ncbi:hypothetical protein OIU77_011158 [Salix suchowensis]|uniref:PSI subunit V n=1 Tax=Salix suchowensis TaxID=1278906 RepID=A0ABQ9AD19_9ROSI|nr:hypothetical protein OIU77_011158 [Salix suchowensis]
MASSSLVHLSSAGPLRNTEYAGAAGSLAAGGLVVILSICLTMYGAASFAEGEPSIAPSLTLTGRKKKPDQLQTSDGWAKFTGGFFLLVGFLVSSGHISFSMSLTFLTMSSREKSTLILICLLQLSPVNVYLRIWDCHLQMETACLSRSVNIMYEEIGIVCLVAGV